jgi:hypothetical protein
MDEFDDYAYLTDDWLNMEAYYIDDCFSFISLFF